MRAIPTLSLRALLAQETDELFIMLVTVTHSSLPAPIYVCSDIAPVISNNRYFFGWRFDIQFPSDATKQLPRAQAVIDNIDPIIGDTILAMSAEPTSPQIAGNAIKVTLELIRHDDPDAIIAQLANLTLRSVKVEDSAITGTLTYEDILNEPLAAAITPSTVPGVFG